MSWDKIRAAIDGFIKTNWTSTPIAWENIAYTPVVGTAWIRPTIFDAGITRKTITGNPATGRSYYGVLMVNIFIPLGVGSGAGYGYIDSLSTLFQEKTITFNGTDQIFFGSGETMPKNDQDKEWHQVTWSIPFEHDKF